ncbi:transcriptional regulator NrdR [candidate division KSB1 bacterium]
MKCPYCTSQDDHVIDSRVVRDGDAIRRRRECGNCGGRYTTYEYIENITHTVVKLDGKREDFDRQKLEKGIQLACAKRPISLEGIQKVVDAVIERLQTMQLREIPTETIGEIIMGELKKLDDVAYLRFASVYRKFEEKEDFVKEVRDIGK